uniref:Uncharacterized protein n=1 Tax=Arundo donax TaxID=35708 RepID=A0A0A9DBH4_ARUDO
MLRLLAEGVLVVVHPNLEDVALDADLVGELLHGGLVVLLDAPPDALRERQHLVLLLLGELGAEPLLAGSGPARARGASAAQGHAAQRVQRRHGPRHPGQVVAVVAPAVGGGRERQRPRRVPRGGGRRSCRGHVVLRVVEVPGRGAVVRGELVVRRGAVGDNCGGGDGRVLRGRGYLAVEVPVAVARGAAERVEGALLARGHELAAPVHGVAPDADSVVLEALAVPPARAAARSLRAAAGLAGRLGRHAADEPSCLRRGLVAGAQHRRHRRHLVVAVIVVVEVHGRRSTGDRAPAGRCFLCLACALSKRDLARLRLR